MRVGKFCGERLLAILTCLGDGASGAVRLAIDLLLLGGGGPPDLAFLAMSLFHARLAFLLVVQVERSLAFRTYKTSGASVSVFCVLFAAFCGPGLLALDIWTPEV